MYDDRVYFCGTNVAVGPSSLPYVERDKENGQYCATAGYETYSI